MRIYIERFILAILAALAVLLAVTNPMEFSRTAENPRCHCHLYSGCILAAIAAYFAEKHNEWRWERLRSLWWLWAIFGASGGVAFALWLIPLIAGVPASDNEARLRALQSQLEAARQERDHATQNLATLQSHLASTTAELTNAGQNLADTQRVLNELRLQRQLTIGPNVAIDFASSLGLS